MAEAAKLIETKTKAFAKSLTDSLAGSRTAAVKKLAKDKKIDVKEAEKLVLTVTFEMEKTKETLSRSPEDQAAQVAKGSSWTCASAHMVDKARHVLMKITPAGKTSGKASWDLVAAFGSKEEHFLTQSAFKSEFGKQMKSADLKNHKGGDGYGDGDGFHVELADGKLLRSDKAVVACMIEYAKLTRIDGQKPNMTFENKWKSDLKPHIEAAEKKAAEKAKEALRLERYTGECRGSASLAKGLSKSGNVTKSGLPDILPPSPLDPGKATTKKLVQGGVAVWDSLARGVFEFLGLAPTSGFDIKVICGVQFTTISYEYLSQTYLTDLSLSAMVVFNTPAASAMKMDISATYDIALTKRSDDPDGTVIFTIKISTPIDTLVATVACAVKGASVKTTVAYK